MPQMAPLNWPLLFIVFTMIFLSTSIKTFFTSPLSPSHNENNKTSNYLYKINFWKWLLIFLAFLIPLLRSNHILTD